MRKKSLKCAVLAAVAGTLLQLGGCLGGGLGNLVLGNLIADTLGSTLNLGSLLGGVLGTGG